MVGSTLNLAQTTTFKPELVKNIKSADKNEFASAGKAVGLEIWRIENFKCVPVAPETFGQFFTGDSYIILSTYKKNPNSAALSWDLHFWLGSKTSQDEAGVAAYKSVELDESLGGAPVQHRQVQGAESELFLSYFKKFTLLEGGVASGFKHTEPEKYHPRLLQVKGNRKNMVVCEVPLERSALNDGDVFILDKGLQLFQWNGSACSPSERSKASEVICSIQSERKGLPKCTVVESKENVAEFWSALAGGFGDVKSAAEGGSDIAVQSNFQKTLYCLSDATGKITFTQVAKGPVSKSMFNTNEVYVYDAGIQVFVWIGKGSSAEEKKGGLKYAQEYLTQNNRPFTTPISKVMEGYESDLFVKSLDA